jgi:hypothetical protein
MDHIRSEKIREQLGTALRWKRCMFSRPSGERMWTNVAPPPRKMVDCKPTNRPSSVGKTYRRLERAVSSYCLLGPYHTDEKEEENEEEQE